MFHIFPQFSTILRSGDFREKTIRWNDATTENETETSQISSKESQERGGSNTSHYIIHVENARSCFFQIIQIIRPSHLLEQGSLRTSYSSQIPLVLPHHY